MIQMNTAEASTKFEPWYCWPMNLRDDVKVYAKLQSTEPPTPTQISRYVNNNTWFILSSLSPVLVHNTHHVHDYQVSYKGSY